MDELNLLVLVEYNSHLTKLILVLQNVSDEINPNFFHFFLNRKKTVNSAAPMRNKRFDLVKQLKKARKFYVFEFYLKNDNKI